ncbi:iron ABC transporter permease [Paenibacillus sp. p3-SID867]|uniref:FecCD family ABC transporter permease n=1 Tax=Paenibacillus sp. p3-SID867 TaxID=2916363 RepID=UPI0021A72BAE|nr:iron ABC transporter permease [Paenibacillus sp. p3-SID867]MCT1403002.1 iron ABC transporter permease [Paenibacillus sp. p3-SID867]
MPNKSIRSVSVIIIFMVLAIAASVLSIATGAVMVPLRDIAAAVLQHDLPGVNREIIWNIRLPRTLVAMLVGANLAVSGALLQGIMRNPLADPHIIGVSSGAGLFGIFLLVVMPQYDYLLTPAAFIGATLAAFIIYLLSWKDGVNPLRIVLAGVAVSAFLGSGISAMLTFYSDRVQGALLFMVGGLAAKSWPDLSIILPYSLIGLALSMLFSKQMNIMMLGDATARSLGIRVELSRLWITAIATLLAASAVSIAGLLGFVGLIIPHVARLLVGGDYRFLIPSTALLGAAVLTICDTLARIMFSPMELPVGIIMGVLGAPFFLYLLRRKKA